MNQLLKQIDFDILAIEYLARVGGKLTPANLQVVRNYFNNKADDLLEGILSIDEARKSKSSGIILLTKVKRYNRQRRKAA